MRNVKIPANHSVVLTIAACAIMFALYSGCSKTEQSVPATADSISKKAGIDTAKSISSPQTSTAVSGLALAGQKIFYSTSYGKIKDACASCHADGHPATKDTRIRAGHTLVGITSRTSTWNSTFKGDALAKNAGGATMCAVMYQHKGDELATVIPKADIDALNAYFDAIKNNPGAIASNLNIAWVTKPALHEEDNIDVKAATTAAKKIMMLPGDPGAGKAVFTNACQYCHEMNESKVGPAMSKEMDDPRAAAMSVRCGSGAMPFYTSDILSDQQIADVLAYIQQQLEK
jgi:mono/diheme cytochrome c family protein